MKLADETPLLDSGLFTVVVAGVVGVVMLSAFFLPLKRAEAESGLTPTYEERCTGRRYLGFGFFGTYLSLRISFYDEFIVLGAVLRRVIPYSSVKSVEFKQLFISKGIVIHTQNPDARFALFPRQPQKMLELFAGKGVAVTSK